MYKFVTLWIGHIVLLLLATTNFTLVSCFLGNVSLDWNFYTYSYQNGWGYQFVSNYSLSQALCYFAAYGLGLAAFSIAWFSYRLRGSMLATLLCAVGLISFGIELTHWIGNHHLSWIASAPIAMLVLNIIIGLQLPKMLRLSENRKTSNPMVASESPIFEAKQ